MNLTLTRLVARAAPSRRYRKRAKAMSESFIGKYPPGHFYRAGVEFDCCCARCGSSIETEHCGECEDGMNGHDCGEDCCCCAEPEENVECQYCDGTGLWRTCLSSPDWCNANPLTGREGVKRGEIEWFTTEEMKNG